MGFEPDQQAALYAMKPSRDEEKAGAQIVVHSDGHAAHRLLVRVTLDLLLPEGFDGDVLANTITPGDVIQASVVPAKIVMVEA